jgi:outer membrane protein
MKNFLALVFTLFLHTSASAAPDLIDVYQQALESDPIYKQAYSTYMAAREASPQAMSQLLPQVNGTGYWNKIDYNSTNPNPLFSTGQYYRQWNYALTITQPVFNVALWKREQQASQQVRQAQAIFFSAAQDLMLRVATAYFAVLEAKDNVRNAKSKERANKRQMDQASQRFKVGLDAITSVYEAEAAYDLSKAQVITDENNLSNQYENLKKLTNRTYKKLDPLRDQHLPLIKPHPINVDDWVSTALKQNYLLNAAIFAKQAANTNIKIKNAGNLPTISVQGTITDTNSDAAAAIVGSDIKQNTIGLNINFPFYQGGLVVSQTRQAVYDFQTAQEKFEQVYRDTLVNTRINYNNIIDGISTVRADRQAVKSGENSVESTEAQFKVGTRTMVDVVTTQTNLFQAQTKLAVDQYRYILSLLRLKFLAGTLSGEDLMQINAWLATNRPYTPGPGAPKQRQARNQSDHH